MSGGLEHEAAPSHGREGHATLGMKPRPRLQQRLLYPDGPMVLRRLFHPKPTSTEAIYQLRRVELGQSFH